MVPNILQRIYINLKMLINNNILYPLRLSNTIIDINNKILYPIDLDKMEKKIKENNRIYMEDIKDKLKE